MTSSVNAPSDSVASKALIYTQTATTRVKELIVEGIQNGWPEARLTTELNKTIAAYVDKLKDNPLLAEQTRKALVTSARKWYYQLNTTCDILNRNFANKAAGLGIDVCKILRDNPKGPILSNVRNILTESDRGIVPLIEDYKSKLKVCLRAVSADPATAVRSDGKKLYKISTRNLAEMTVRYNASMSDLRRLIESGVKLVWTTSHPNCSLRCAPYQGRLWSLDGTSGVVDGIKYSPIEEALSGPRKDGNGIISGYNCRHRLVAYKRGDKAPVEYTEAEIKEEYAKDKRQRYYENNIRQMKIEERLLRKAGETDAAKALRKRWQKATTDYRLESYKMGRPYYPYRCIVDESETRFTYINPADKSVYEAPLTENFEIGITNDDKSDKIIKQCGFEKIVGSHDVDDDIGESSKPKCNPNYGSPGYDVNCQRCVQAYDFRRRGYDVVAKSKPEKDNTIEWGNECFIDSNGNMPQFVFNQSEKSVKKQLGNAPDGARYLVYVSWKKGDAHIFIGEKHNGEVQYVDPQAGITDASMHFENGKPNQFAYLRIDDKQLTNDLEIIKATMEKRK